MKELPVDCISILGAVLVNLPRVETVLSTKEKEDQITMHKVNNSRLTAVMITGFEGGFE